ncbi:MAG: tetratricopeptide repeat protein [Gemmatimonadaceae bacterium]
MTSDTQRTARDAFDAARAPFERLSTTADPVARCSALRDAWSATEGAMQTLAGTSALSGTPLMHELRQRHFLSLDDAHALVDFQAAAERAATEGYAPSPADVNAALFGRERLVAALSRDEPRPGPGAAPASGPVSPGAAARPAPPPPGAIEVPAPRVSKAGIAMVTVLVALVALGAYYAMNVSREPAELRQGRAAFAAGDRLTARNAFAAAAGAHPTLAEPHVYLGRLARDAGDMATASAELRRAVEVEPDNPLAHRELAALLLSTGELELARSFYQRAIQLNPADSVALGWMACTLHRLGRYDLAPRFAQRAGLGAWQACLATAPPPPATVTPR